MEGLCELINLLTWLRVKEVQNLHATYNVASFFSFIDLEIFTLEN